MSKLVPLQEYIAPDADVSLLLGQELITTPEALFRPSLIGFDMKGLPALIHETIMKCAIDVRRPLYENILLVGMHLMSYKPSKGANSQFPGLTERLMKELEALSTSKVKIVAHSNRRFASWIGGMNEIGYK